MSYCSDLTRERIMECAKAEFLKKGFQAAQLKDIVAAAKVTTVLYIVTSRIKRRCFLR